MPKKSILSDPLVKSLIVDVIKDDPSSNDPKKDEENLPIVKALIKGINTDEEIAEKTEIRLNIVRKVLYKLYDAKLASYKRSKDPETQWFTYSWKFEEQEVINHIKKDSEECLKMLNNELEKEEDTRGSILGLLLILFLFAGIYLRIHIEQNEEKKIRETVFVQAISEKYKFKNKE